MKKLLGISLVAIMSVSAANAEIASKAYVDQLDTAMDSRVTTVEGNITTLNSDASTPGSVAKKIADAIGDLGEGNDTVAEAISAVSTAAGNAVVANEAITAGTHTKITYDAKGLVTGGENITLSDVTDVTATASEVNQLASSGVTTADLTKLHAITADASELNILDGVTASTAELNILDGVTATTAEINQLTGLTLGTAASAAVATGTGAAGVTDDGTGLVTADQVYEYVAANAGASNFIEDSITDGTTNKAPSENAVYDALALKEDVISATNKVDIAHVDVTNYASSDLATAVTNARDSAQASATTNQVVTSVTMTDGVLSVGSADPLSVTNYTKQGIDQGAGKYALTALVDGSNNITGYAWELIERAQQGSGN